MPERGDLKILDGGFPIYGQKNLPKINAMRMAFSVPTSTTPVVNTKGEALFTTAEELHDEPASCYNCQFYNEKAETCSLMGRRTKIRKFIWPKAGSPDAKQIEYWPCCSMQFYGEPNKSEATYRTFAADPDYMGLIWINAPKPGQEYGGANCGGVNGGDDCDHYLTEGKEEKWESLTGFCRALQCEVAAGDVCCQWRDDDKLEWQDAQRVLGELDGTG
jgi:hypothetical protein